MYKVKDHADLRRDPHTGAIINMNSLDHEKYIAILLENIDFVKDMEDMYSD